MKRYADPQAVEQQLRKIQQEISPNEARTNLFNLVVYVSDNDDRLLIDALNFLHGKRPARVIVIRQNHGGVTHTDVTARCVPDENDKVLCIQEIVIFSGDDKAGEAPETWAPLLIREIPVFIWWLSPLDNAPLPELFDDVADRCFIDSVNSADPLAFYTSLSKRFGTFKTPVSDFAWVRLSPLLKLTAHFFNPAEMRPRLHDLSKVVFDGGEVGEVLLFFEWMKSKLEWKGTAAASGTAWKLKKEGAALELVHKNPTALEKGFTITFTTTKGEVFTLKDSLEGYAKAEGEGVESYSSVFRFLNTGEALLYEADKNASDRLFLDILENW